MVLFGSISHPGLFLVVPSGSLWFLVVIEGYFGFLVVFGGSWWCLVVLDYSPRVTNNYQEPKKHSFFGSR